MRRRSSTLVTAVVAIGLATSCGARAEEGAAAPRRPAIESPSESAPAGPTPDTTAEPSAPESNGVQATEAGPAVDAAVPTPNPNLVTPSGFVVPSIGESSDLNGPMPWFIDRGDGNFVADPALAPPLIPYANEEGIVIAYMQREYWFHELPWEDAVLVDSDLNPIGYIGDNGLPVVGG